MTGGLWVDSAQTTPRTLSTHEPVVSLFGDGLLLVGGAYAEDESPTRRLAEQIAIAGVRRMAEQGDVQRELGGAYWTGTYVEQDYVEAVRWWRLAAEQGDDVAQANLGSVYSDGIGVPQGHVESMRWYRRAAEQGHIRAQAVLGFSYWIGLGVEQDIVKGTRWIRLAAEQPGGSLSGYAQRLLGMAYRQGIGVIQDYVAAHAWPSLAAAVGDAEAREWRDELSKEMTRDQIATAQRVARELWERIEARSAAGG